MSNDLRMIGAVAACLLIVASAAEAIEYSFDARLSATGTQNLLRDSSDQDDTYSTASLSADIYPVSIARLNLLSEYTRYGNLTGLSNFLYGVGATVIPLSDSADFVIFASANARRRSYEDDAADTLSSGADQFNNADYDALASIGYNLTNSIQLRSGAAFRLSGYTLDEIADKNNYDLFLGGNLTLPWSNVVDVEAGLSHGNFQYIIDSARVYPIREERAYDVLTDGDLSATYYSVRLSRPLGTTSGLSLVFSRRTFYNYEDRAIVYGYSTGLLSPWVNSYEGNAIQARVKTFAIPGVIITGGFSYSDREHHKTLERGYNPLTGAPMIGIFGTAFAKDRTDVNRRGFITIQVPIAAGSGAVLEPMLRIEGANNSSTIPVYTYSDITATLGITYSR